MPGPQVKRVIMSSDNDSIVYVEFEDGHWLTFIETYEFFRNTTSLEMVWLENANRQQLVLFHSRYQHPVNRTPFGFAKTSPGWTAQRFAAYWQAASDHIAAAAKAGRLVKHWRVIAKGGKDLREIQAGEWPMPSTK